MKNMVAYLVVAAAAAALAWFGGQSAPALRAGFLRLDGALDEMLILATLGLIAAGLSNAGRALAFGVTLGALVIAAYLTTRGLELPERSLSIMLALFIIGLIGAVGGRFMDWLSPIAALAGLVIGHALTNARPSGDPIFLAGLALGAAALMALGAAIASAAEEAEGGASRRLAAGVAGIGLYLIVGAYVF